MLYTIHVHSSNSLDGSDGRQFLHCVRVRVNFICLCVLLACMSCWRIKCKQHLLLANVVQYVQWSLSHAKHYPKKFGTLVRSRWTKRMFLLLGQRINNINHHNYCSQITNYSEIDLEKIKFKSVVRSAENRLKWPFRNVYANTYM